MRYIFNPSLLNLDQSSRHVAAVALKLIMKVLIDRRVSLIKSIINETDKTIMKILIVVKTFNRRLYILDTS